MKKGKKNFQRLETGYSRLTSGSCGCNRLFAVTAGGSTIHRADRPDIDTGVLHR
jgi:hypothetical protein